MGERQDRQAWLAGFVDPALDGCHVVVGTPTSKRPTCVHELVGQTLSNL